MKFEEYVKDSFCRIKVTIVYTSSKVIQFYNCLNQLW